MVLEILAVLGIAAPFVAAGGLIRRAGRVARSRPDPTEGPQPRTEYARRLLKHVERRRIAELEEGQAAVIRGRARAILGVPLLPTMVPGLYAIAANAHVYTMGNTSEQWGCVDFELVDDSGTIRVGGAGVDVAIVRNVTRHSDASGDRAEGVIVPDSEVLVLGIVSIEGEVGDYRDGAQRRVLRALETFPVVVSNDGDLFEPGDVVLTMQDVIDNMRRERGG